MAEDRGSKDGRPPRINPLHQIEIDDFRRDRLLAALALLFGASFCLGLPFALQAGAEFFLPLTAAIVIAIALVPLLEWLERRGLPSALAAFFALAVFLAIINAALAIIVVPATGWFARIPESIPRIQTAAASPVRSPTTPPPTAATQSALVKPACSMALSSEPKADRLLLVSP